MADTLSKLFVVIGAKTDEFSKGMDGVSDKLKKAGAIMTGVGAAITGALGVAVKSAADFEGAMREVNTMMLLSEGEFKQLSDDTLKLAMDLGVDAVGAAKALYQAISAGVPKENVIDFLSIATKAAIGGVTDTETAVDGLTTVMNAFKLPMSDAQKVADLMFTTVKGGKTTFEELSASLFNVAPIAASMGIEFETVSAALATMTKQGVPTAQATTQLRQAMVALSKPTTEMQAVIESLGYSSGQAMLDELGFADAINVLRDATQGNNEQLMKMFGSVEAGGAILALTGQNAAMFKGDLDAMANSSGAATAAFDQMEMSAGRQLEKLKEQFKGIGISIGTALLPKLSELLEKIKPIIEKIIDWISRNPKLFSTIVIIIGAIGGILLVVGPLLIMLPGLIALLPMLGAAFTAMLGPIGLIILAIAAAIAIGILIYKNWDKIKEKAKEIWGAIKNFFAGIADAIKWIFLNMTPVGLIIKHWDDLKAAAEKIWNGIKGFFSKVGDSIKSKFASDWEETRKATNIIWGKIQENSEQFGGGVKGTILGAIKTMVDGVRNFLQMMGIDTERLTSWIQSIWERIARFITNIPVRIRSAFATLADIMLAPFRAAARGIERGINWIIRQVNRIKVTIPDWVPGIGGKTFGFNIPEISLPSFQYGGVVPGAIGKPQLVLAHGGEAILPAGQAAVNNYFQGPWIVREEADIYKIARELFVLQERKARAMGI